MYSLPMLELGEGGGGTSYFSWFFLTCSFKFFLMGLRERRSPPQVNKMFYHFASLFQFLSNSLHCLATVQRRSSKKPRKRTDRVREFVCLDVCRKRQTSWATLLVFPSRKQCNDTRALSPYSKRSFVRNIRSSPFFRTEILSTRSALNQRVSSHRTIRS